MSDQPTERELLEQLVAQTTATFDTYKVELNRINANLEAAHTLAANHNAGILALRADQEGLAKLLNAQTQAFNALRDVALRHAQALENHTAVIKTHAGAIVRLWELAGLPIADAPTEPPTSVN